MNPDGTKEGEWPQGLPTAALQSSSVQSKRIRSHKHEPLNFEFSRYHFENVKDQGMMTVRKLRQEDDNF